MFSNHVAESVCDVIGMYNDCLSPLYVRIPESKEFLRVRCGKCITCKLHRTSEWSLRLFMEAQYWRNISHLTLTYTDDYLPVDYTTEENLFYVYEDVRPGGEVFQQEDSLVCIPSLNPADMRNFLKRLRKSGIGEYHCFRKAVYKDNGEYSHDTCEWRTGIKFYGVGEYGTQGTLRPHLHIVLFGVEASQQNQALISKIWGKGRICLKPCFPETFGYVAGYVQKKLYGENRNPFRFPEFMRCSQRLGMDWIIDHRNIFDSDHAYIPFSGKDGKSFKFGIPRYFRDFLVADGRIDKVSVVGLAFQQQLEFMQLGKWLKSAGISERDFFRQRFKDCNFKFRKKQSRRNQTGDI